MKKDSRTLEERAADLEKVITFNIVNSVRRNYKSVEDFRRVYSAIVGGTAGSADQVKFCGLFGFRRENQRRILTHHPMNGGEARKQAKGGFRILMQYFLNAFQR